MNTILVVDDDADIADLVGTRLSGGTGLGPAIAKNIVSLHGGTITAYNEPNRRTLFEVRLPVGSPFQDQL